MKNRNKDLFSPIIFKIFLLCIITLMCSKGFSVTLKDKFEKAEAGDYIVTLENKTFSLLVIQNIFYMANRDKIISLGEITIPQNNINSTAFSWKKWADENMPGKSSYNLYEIDLTNSTILRCYSFTKKCFFSSTDQDNFFTKLLTLPLEKLSDQQRKKIGAPPLDNDLDTRSLWNPSQVIDGVKQKKTNFDVYQTTWPKDGTDLSGKIIDIYFDKEGFSPFPYWIQVSNGNIDVMLKIIDSGKHMKCDKQIPK